MMITKKRIKIICILLTLMMLVNCVYPQSMNKVNASAGVELLNDHDLTTLDAGYSTTMDAIILNADFATESSTTMDALSFSNLTDWTPKAGTWTMEGNEYRVVMPSGNAYAYADGVYKRDGMSKISADIYNPSGGYSSILFMQKTLTATEGGYAVQLRPSNGTVRLMDFKGSSTYQSQITTFTKAEDGWYHVEITLSGNTIAVSVNGTNYINYVEDGSKSVYTEGRFGLNTYNNEITFRNLQVTFNQYNITYVLDGGSNGINAPLTYTPESDTALPIPVKSNYTFMGWYTYPEYSGSPVTKIVKGDTGNKTLYARWTNNLTGINGNLSDKVMSIDGSGLFAVNSGTLAVTGKGDNFALFNESAGDFLYKAKIKFNPAGEIYKDTAAALVFRYSDKSNCYIANINETTLKGRLFKFQNGKSFDLVPQFNIQPSENHEYDLEVVAVGKLIQVYLNGDLVANNHDITVKGEDSAILTGAIGFLTWGRDVLSSASYSDVYLYGINSTNTPQLTNVEVIAGSEKVMSKDTINAKQVQFKPSQYNYYVDVSNTIDRVDLIAASESGTAIMIKNENGEIIDGHSVSLTTGFNKFVIQGTNADSATISYKLTIYRQKTSKEQAYWSQYRNQYHYSPQEHWLNDPNGLVYFQNKWHLFYQYYPEDVIWGPMHWGHAVSEDLIHWTEESVVLTPDNHGTMYSGCAVVDEGNTSGLFSSEAGGIVAIFTQNGNGQRQSLAYSEDGIHWELYEGNPIIPSNAEGGSSINGAFRDPKIFRYSNKWFMVIAGGPLRIYSSDNLINWKFESSYAQAGSQTGSAINTECPDMFPLTVEGTGIQKWVVNYGGRFYKIGDFKEIDGKWTFIPDEAYWNDADKGIMNFSKDSYAAMTYYIPSYSTETRRIMINWMNNWNYCNAVPEANGNDLFNGTFNLQHELSLIEQGGKIVLKQTPIAEYDSLRGTPLFKQDNLTISPDANVLESIKANQYEVVARFKPEPGTTQVGFKLRVGDNEETLVYYNIEAQSLVLDRRKSGKSPNNFAQMYSQKASLDPDGYISMRVYVDWSSVEVLGNQGVVAGAAQIFPKASSLGMAVYTLGGNSEADITIYPLKSIWHDDSVVTEPMAVEVSNSKLDMFIGEEFTISSSVQPLSSAPQDVIWTLVEGSAVEIVGGANAKTVSVKAVEKGTAILKVTAKGTNLSATCSITVGDSFSDSNLTGWRPVSGTWSIEDGDYRVVSTSNAYAYADGVFKRDGIIKYSADIYNPGGGYSTLLFMQQSLEATSGGYALQVRPGRNNVRLMDFKGDFTYHQATNLVASSDGWYHVEIALGETSIIVTVNGIEYINYVENGSNPIYTEGRFGLNTYNNDIKFSNVRVDFNEFNISYELDGGSTDTNARTKYTPGESAELPGPVKDNHVFIGWYTNADFTGTPVTRIVKGDAGDKTFYAKWAKINQLYNITYVLDGGSNPQNAPATYSSAEEIQLPIPVKSGYNFVGWYTNADFTGAPATKIVKGDAGDKTFYAKWARKAVTAPEQSESPSQPEIYAVVGGIKSAVSMDGSGRIALQIEPALLKKAFDQSEAGSDGEKTITIELPKSKTENYQITLPATELKNKSKQNIIIITDTVQLELPGQMLLGTGLEDQERVTIMITEGDKSKLPEHVRKDLGDKPLVEIALYVNGERKNWNNPNAPVTVSIPYKPTAAELKDPEHIVVWYIDGSGKVNGIPSGRYNAEKGVVTFTTTHFSHYAVAFVKKTFNDLDNVAWAQKSIEVMASKGVISGTGNGAYSPSHNITRADYLVLLIKTFSFTAEFESNFSDVKPGVYYYDAIGIARQLGITEGSGNNMFSPNTLISRQDMIVLTARALEKANKLQALGELSALDQFTDKGELAPYAVKNVADFVKNGLIVGSGNKINPKSYSTRAEAAVLLYKLYLMQ